MLVHAFIAHELDSRPDVYRPSARLAEFISTRDRHPTNPTARPHQRVRRRHRPITSRSAKVASLPATG